MAMQASCECGGSKETEIKPSTEQELEELKKRVEKMEKRIRNLENKDPRKVSTII